MIVSSTPFKYLWAPSVQKSKSPCIPEINDSEFCVFLKEVTQNTKTLCDEGRSKEIPLAVLLKFVSKGDNIPDALGLVEHLNEWLQIIKPRCNDPTASALLWKIPSSWRLLSGSSLSPVLF
uniref:Uncharacterized protein n=1 Tax=Equus asinus TaxID=9793 RepID=A0A8C4KXB8_EQUAS